VEFTLSQNGNILSAESYNMGTVRLLKNLSGEKKSAIPLHKFMREYAEAARHRIDREIGTKIKLLLEVAALLHDLVILLIK
jgi:hypothetical protein